MSNTYTKGYVNGSALTEAQLDTAYQSLQLDIANTALTTTGSASGQALISNGSGIAASFQTLPDPLGPFAIRNYGLKATVATGVLTITLQTKAGITPSGSDPVNFTYSTNGTTSATYNAVNVTAATTITVNASATLGGYHTSATNRVFVYGYFNTATTSVKLAVAMVSNMDRGDLITTQAISSSADSGFVLYATAALTVSPRLLGSIDIAQAATGAWQTPSKVHITNNAYTGPLDYGRIQTPAAAVSLGNVAVADASGTFTATSSNSIAITGLSCNLDTTGRPVMVMLVADGQGTDGVPTSSSVVTTNTNNSGATVRLLRDGIVIAQYSYIASTVQILAPVSLMALDIAVAGVKTYTASLARASATGNATITNVRLIAYEI